MMVEVYMCTFAAKMTGTVVTLATTVSAQDRPAIQVLGSVVPIADPIELSGQPALAAKRMR